MSSLISNIVSTLILIGISYIIFYSLVLHYELDSTARMVVLARYCNKLYYVPREEQVSLNHSIGIDNYAEFFISERIKKNHACSFLYNFAYKLLAMIAQRTFYFDKVLAETIQSNEDFKQLVVLGAGN